MEQEAYRFAEFILDPEDRRLLRDGVPVDLNARYLDALALLVREQGRLVTKDRFLGEVWRGVPVTDEALTQCIRYLRRALADDSSRPRFIETVPKHGYRFIAPVEHAPVTGDDREASSPSARASVAPGPVEEPRAPESYPGRALFVRTTIAATVGGGSAGLIGGLFYGFAGASQPLGPGIGSASVLLVLICLTVVAALVGGLGVGLGLAASLLSSPRLGLRTVIGGALGGLVVGACAKLLGLDAFNLLLGRSPGDITGAAEGLVLGAAVGLGLWLAARHGRSQLRRSALIAGAAGLASGLLITALGGRLMGGSLDLLARSFPGSQLRLDQIGAPFGESGFGPISQVVTGGLEGMLFAACITASLIIARRHFAAGPAERNTPSSTD